MNLEADRNDLFRTTCCFGDISLSPQVRRLNEEKLTQLFEQVQSFSRWREDTKQTHRYGIILIDKKKYIFSISTEKNYKILNIRQLGEFF